MRTEKDDPINWFPIKKDALFFIYLDVIITRIMIGIARKKMSMTSVYAIPPTP